MVVVSKSCGHQTTDVQWIGYSGFSWDTFELSIPRIALPDDGLCSAFLLLRPIINNVTDYRRRSWKSITLEV